MTLTFVFISSYRNLNNINFNLGGKYSITFDPKSTKLFIEKNENFIDNFFIIENEINSNLPHISMVSAVIGENGVGKTSFLDCLKESLVTESQPNFEGIIVFEDQQTKVLSIFKSGKINFTNQNAITQIDDYKVEFIDYRTYLFLYSINTQESFHPNLYLNEKLKNISLVYLSNIFDKKEESELQGLFNLSTNFLIRNDFKIKLENNQINIGADIIGEHKFSEINRELDFIHAFKSEFKSILNFKLPNQLLFFLIKNDQLISDISSKYFSKTINLLKNIYNNKDFDIKSNQYFVYNYFITALSNIISELHKYKLDHHLLVFNENNIIIEDNLVNKPIDFIVNVIDQFSNNVISSSQIKDEFKALKEMVLFLDDYTSTENDSKSKLYFSFFLTNKHEEEIFFKFYDLYRKTYIFDPYINFSWAELSTGQKALLNIYSRLYSITNNGEFKPSNDLEENIILLIDEGELYLHPTWQKELLFQLLKVLPHIFKPKLQKANPKSIQIILTSNSPLIISDIPSSNIVFLKKRYLPEGEIEIVNEKLTDHKLTFAANIHSLLADSFFMEKGLIGDFASFKVNEIIDLLLGNTDEIKKRKHEIEQVILLIGEPVIKSKLIHMLNERLSLNYFELDRRISKLESNQTNDLNNV